MGLVNETRYGNRWAAPDCLTHPLLLFHANIKGQVTSPTVPEDLTPIPTAHNEFLLPWGAIGFVLEDRQL